MITQPVVSRRKRLLIADMESTIIRQEMLDELAELVGLKDLIAGITYRAMNGEIDFKDALRERVALLKDLPVESLEQVYGLDFKKFVPVDIALRHEVLTKGQADVSIVFTTDPQNKREGFVLLEDDKGMFPPYNSTFTFFGQFFDHGVDQTVKGGASVFVPLRADDPLRTLGADGKAGTGDELGSGPQFMAITRAKDQPGPDGQMGTSDDVQEADNTDTPWVARRPLKPQRFIAPAKPLPCVTPRTSTICPATK